MAQRCCDVRALTLISLRILLALAALGGPLITCGCGKSPQGPAQGARSIVAAAPTSSALKSMDSPGLSMVERLQLLNASINLDEVLYQNRRKASRLRTLVEAEKDPTLRGFMLPQYAEQLLKAGETEEAIKQYNAVLAL